MKSLTKHIEERLVINKDFKQPYIYPTFIYKIDHRKDLELFSDSWPELMSFSDCIYVNGEHVEIDDSGDTKKLFKPGEYIVEIRDEYNIGNCYYMFYLTDIYKVIYFDTSKAINMYNMFAECEKLVEVPMLNISSVKMNSTANLHCMFYNCTNLNNETKLKWDRVYDFKTNMTMDHLMKK